MNALYETLLSKININNEDIIKCMVAVPYRILIEIGLLNDINDKLDISTLQNAVAKFEEYIKSGNINKDLLAIYDSKKSKNIDIQEYIKDIKETLKSFIKLVNFITNMDKLDSIDFNTITEKLNKTFVYNVKLIRDYFSKFVDNKATLKDYLEYTMIENINLPVVLTLIVQLISSLQTILNADSSVCDTCPVSGNCNLKYKLKEIRSTIYLLNLFDHVHKVGSDIENLN